ncbi:MAG: hypothetical protein IKS55_04330 [Oscillospiraceae bacterium]|nr:hypothetical protein [Oscillospiraceae bacterium]
MKKALILLLALSVALSLAGCGSGAAPDETGAPAADTKPAEEVSPAAPAVTSDPTPVPLPAPTPESVSVLAEIAAPQEKDPDAVDVDLTQLSSTMVYSEVYAMMVEPEEYFGKSVKMRGLFATQEYDGERYYACIVQDATACCAQGLEFQLSENRVYPDDYPDPGSEITVIGTFDTYSEEVDGNTYNYLVLKDDSLCA